MAPSRRPRRGGPVRNSTGGHAARSVGGRGCCRCCRDVGVVGRLAGERQEHLVQAGQVQGQLGDARCPRRSSSDDGGRPGPPRRRPERSAARASASGSPGPIRDRMPATSSSRLRSAGRTSMRWPPTIRLSPSGVSWAITRPWSITRDLVGQRVGLLQVLRGEQHGGAVVDQPPHDAPHVLALGRVEPGGGLVQEDHRRAADQAGGQVEPAAHAAGVGLGGPAGRLGQVEPVEQLGARALASPAGRSSSGPISTRFWVPVRSSSTEAYCPVRPIMLADPVRRP